jgi:hypothetical protein
MTITFDPTVGSHCNFYRSFQKVVSLEVAMELLLSDEYVWKVRPR